MTIDRRTKDHYIVIVATDVYSVEKTANDHWLVRNDDLRICRSCDDLSEALDFIDFIELV